MKKYNFGKSFAAFALVWTMMLPAAVTLIPQFLIFRGLGWIDTLRPLWVTAFLGSAFNIFLLRQFFMTIPMELEDAAKIDGCSYPRTFWQVMLPQVRRRSRGRMAGEVAWAAKKAEIEAAQQTTRHFRYLRHWRLAEM